VERDKHDHCSEQAGREENFFSRCTAGHAEGRKERIRRPAPPVGFASPSRGTPQERKEGDGAMLPGSCRGKEMITVCAGIGNWFYFDGT